MSAPTLIPPSATQPLLLLPPEAVPSVDHLITVDDTPVDSIYAERQEHLLVDPLYECWIGPGTERTFVALANVGMFFADDRPPLVPDVLLSLDVRLPPHLREKRYRSYFFWQFGKAPDVCVEVVSNLEGDELGEKLRMYAQLGIPYYVVWDPLKLLRGERLRVFVLRGRSYQGLDPAWFPELGLGVQIWHGRFRDAEEDWLRWVDANGQVIPTGGERAEKLAAQLRALGIEPSA